MGLRRMNQVIWMFSGQGSQYYQMGMELYENDSVFRGEMAKADCVVQGMMGESLLEIIYRPRPDRFEPFRRILHTHPAILMIECALARTLLERGLKPDLLLGYSLGELTCMVVAGAVSFEEALVTVVQQAELLERGAPEGGMVAVLDSPDLLTRHPEAFAECEVAGYHFPRNFIVSGPVHAITRLLRFLKEKEISSRELAVAHPFHSTWMAVVEASMKAVSERMKFGTPKIPVVSAHTGQRVEVCSAAHLWEATSRCVDLARAIRGLEESGPHLYVDLGPSGSMATAVKYNLAADSKSEFLSVITPFGQERKHIERLIERMAGEGRS